MLPAECSASTLHKRVVLSKRTIKHYSLQERLELGPHEKNVSGNVVIALSAGPSLDQSSRAAYLHVSCCAK